MLYISSVTLLSLRLHFQLLHFLESQDLIACLVQCFLPATAYLLAFLIPAGLFSMYSFRTEKIP